MSPTAYPLTWPHNIPRSKPAAKSNFRTGLSAAIKNVRGSLQLFAQDSGKKVDAIVISSNVTLGEDKPQDPGVAVWFTGDGMSVCIAVDRYPKVEDNVQAIHHIIDGRRTELRHGGLHIVRATFTGFQALPAPSTKRSWRQVFGFGPNEPISASYLKERYRAKSKYTHPDSPNGSKEDFEELTRARDEALREIGQ
ncbi:J domain-containing protein [Pararhizobium sp. BT-229]|uniref:J domain-containing protein n=1 Tax=Pararhizobium sp. BT-229 TaxID=2986923 RepID=UPI0021F7E1D7|nr:J domain-containing protein [Pararhizobium sp. BT-229]MCV9960786.1 J domain-containing protein [Pararhizobium sp. BT-229]